MKKNTIQPKINLDKSYTGLKTCVVFLLLFISTPLFAKGNLTKKYSDSLVKVERYLNNISNLSADFTQESDGVLVKGKFYLARNNKSAGKMRIEYPPESKILIVVNGSVLSYYDAELDEISYFRTNTTPTSLLTRPNISFTAKDVEITNFKKTQNYIKVSIIKKNRKEAGEFSLVFQRNPLQFVKMEVTNSEDQVIAVTLSNMDFKSTLSDKLFVIKDEGL